MDVSVAVTTPTPGSRYVPNLAGGGTTTNNQIDNGGKAWVAGRNYTITTVIAKGSSAADDANENWTVVVNVNPTAATINIPHGQFSATRSGLSVAIFEGDEIFVQYDALGDGSTGWTIITIHLEPA